MNHFLCNGYTPFLGSVILSCLGKLFGSGLIIRMLYWYKICIIIVYAQLGVRPCLSTINALFLFQCIVNRTLCYYNKRFH